MFLNRYQLTDVEIVKVWKCLCDVLKTKKAHQANTQGQGLVIKQSLCQVSSRPAHTLLVLITAVCIAPVKQIFQCKIVIFYLYISLSMCFECSKELFHLDSSFEYQQHMFWVRNK